MLSLLLSLLFLSLHLSSSSVSVYNNECTTDSDCTRSNGICSHYTGVGKPGRCMCQEGYIFVASFFRCEILTAENSVELVLPNSVSYKEQESLGNGASFLRTRGYLPTHWYCSRSIDYCWGYRTKVTWSIFGGYSKLAANSSIPVQSVSWKCDSVYKPYIRSSDITDIETYTQSMRPLEDNCVSCNCGAHGTCSGGNCVCDSGYSGTLCQTAPSPESDAGYYWINGVFRPGNTLYQGNRACSSDSDCGTNEYCWVNEIIGTNQCWCKSGFTPSSYPSDCVPTSVTTYMGAVDSANVSRYYSGYYSVDSKTTWWTNQTTEVASFSWYPVSASDTYYRANFQHMRHTRCLTAKLGRVCVTSSECTVDNLGIITGSTCNCSRTNFVNGVSSCLCAQGYSGTYCNITSSSCSQSYCSEHGTCQNRSTQCACNAYSYFQSDCSQTASSCRSSRCSSHGTCFENECLCDSGYYGTNCSTTSQVCAESRCSDKGVCLYQTQSCLCNSHFNMYDCRNITCVNGGIKTSDSTCDCPDYYSGVACQNYYCGNYGSIVDGECSCIGVYTGETCAETICEDRGTPTQNGLACSCYSGFAYNDTVGCVWDCNGFELSGNSTCLCTGYHYGNHCQYVADVARILQTYSSRSTDNFVYSIIFIVPFCLFIWLTSVFWKEDPKIFTYHDGATLETIFNEFVKHYKLKQSQS